jgi:phosphomannomutase
VTDPIISVSGLRGVVGAGLTPEVAIRYVAAFAGGCGPGPIIVSRDGRFSGEMLAKAVHAGLQAVGRDTIEAGIAPTPTLGILVRHCRAAGGVQISASHNPPEYNGLKLFSAEGRVLPAGIGQQVLARYGSPISSWVRHDRLGRTDSLADPLTPHLEAVLATVDAERIRRKRFRVLLDSNHGAGGRVGRRLLEALGCQVVVLGEEPDGRFAHPPEPTAENLAGVLAEVVQARADIGFCQDPDADRLAVIDASGRYLGEEYTLALCVNHVLSRRRGPVAANCSTSRMSQDLAEKYGVPFIRSAVGEANVVDAMLAHHAVFGGEGNGGPIDPRVGLVRDSFVGMAQLLDAMAERDAPIGQLADELPRYHIVKTKIALDPGQAPAALASLEKRFTDANVDRLDGLRFDWPDRWLLVRPSNTEPIVRAVAEAATAADAESLCRQAAAILARS